MQNNKFFDTLRTLNKKELAAYAKFLRGNYGNVKIALAVFNYVRAFFPEYRDAKKLDITYAYKKIFGADINEDDYNRLKLLNTLSDLDKWLKEFLLWEKVKGKSLESQVLWLFIAKERGLTDESDKQLKKIRLDIASSDKKSVADLLKDLLVNYYVYYQNQDKKSAPNMEALVQCIHGLDNYFAVTRMKVTCEMVNIQKLLSVVFEPELMIPSQYITEWPHVQAHPLFQIYKEVYALIAKEDATAFSTIVSWLHENYQRISNEDLHIIVSYLHNFVAQQSRLNNREYVPITHRLNRFALTHGYFQRKNDISPTQFTNIVNIACNQKDLDWADHFIASCDIYLKKNERTDTVKLAKAILLFEKNQYEETLELLESIDFTDFEHNIRSKSLIIRCLYELPNQLRFKNYSHTFETFLYRNKKIRPKAVKSTLNFIHLLRLLYVEETPRDKIIEKIKTTTPIYYSEWLLEKAAAYKGRFAAQKRKGR